MAHFPSVGETPEEFNMAMGATAIIHLDSGKVVSTDFGTAPAGPGVVLKWALPSQHVPLRIPFAHMPVVATHLEIAAAAILLGLASLGLSRACRHRPNSEPFARLMTVDEV